MEPYPRNVNPDGLEQNGLLSSVTEHSVVGVDFSSCAAVSLCVEVHAVVLCMAPGIFLLILLSVCTVVWPKSWEKNALRLKSCVKQLGWSCFQVSPSRSSLWLASWNQLLIVHRLSPPGM